VCTAGGAIQNYFLFCLAAVSSEVDRGLIASQRLFQFIPENSRIAYQAGLTS